MSKENLIESIDTFKVNFGGEHKIDAELFTKTINNTIELVKASANAIDPNCFLRLEIKANQEGSFETIIDTVAKYANNIPLLTKDNIRLAIEIVTGYLSYLQIKQHLKGKKAKQIQTKDKKTAIMNQDNTTIQVDSRISDSFFKDAKIDNCIINVFNNLADNKRDNFTIEHNDKKMSFNTNDYEVMQEKVVDEINSTAKLEKQKPIEVDLLLKKPDLLGDSAWQFVYNKNIFAKIEDKEFLQKVHKRQIKTLYAGVKIPCKLQIEYELDENLNPIQNSDKYTILQVVGDIIEPIEDNQELDLFQNEKTN